MLSTFQREALTRARGFIASPDHWTTGYFATDANGHNVPANDRRAVRFCIRGAISLALQQMGAWSWKPNGWTEGQVSRAFEKAAGLKVRTIATWNNCNYHATVLLKLDGGFARAA
mgnify:CR=1 FL=1